MDDQLCAAQHIWWRGSIIQPTETLSDYRYYKIFPSDHIRNCNVTALASPRPGQSIIPASQNPVLDLNDNLDINVHSFQERLDSIHQINEQSNLLTTRCGT